MGGSFKLGIPNFQWVSTLFWGQYSKSYSPGKLHIDLQRISNGGLLVLRRQFLKGIQYDLRIALGLGTAVAVHESIRIWGDIFKHPGNPRSFSSFFWLLLLLIVVVLQAKKKQKAQLKQGPCAVSSEMFQVKHTHTHIYIYSSNPLRICRRDRE